MSSQSKLQFEQVRLYLIKFVVIRVGGKKNCGRKENSTSFNYKTYRKYIKCNDLKSSTRAITFFGKQHCKTE